MGFDLKDQLEDCRKAKLKVDEDFKIQNILHEKNTELPKSTFGWIPVFYSVGDVNRLLPVALKSLADD